MTVIDIKNQVIFKTQLKIHQIKTRNIVLPQQPVDRYRIYDQLSREIYDYAVKTTIDFVDRNEINFDVDSLLNALHPDFCTLSYSAMEILFAKQLESGMQSGPTNVFGVFPKFTN